MFRTALISVFLTSTALADTWTVDDDGKADFDNIQAAVDASSDGDEIIVMPGTYTGSGDEVVDMLGKEIWLHSSEGEQVTIIDGEGTRRGIYCANGETSNTSIEGFTITNGISLVGGGMYNNSSSPTLTGCTFENNTANDLGGGMFNTSGSHPTLTGCTFSGNTSPNEGGGMHNNFNSDPTLTDCTFTDNDAHYGGALFNTQSHPTLTNCTLTGNTAYFGGGMFNSSSSPTLENCTFIGNTATLTGGGMRNASGNPTLTNCTFTGNTAILEGGGMYNKIGSSPTLTDTSVCGNTPDQIYGDWTDNGGNYVSSLCEDEDDDDGDGVPDYLDNCYLYNPDQADCNDNDIGDVCDISDGISEDCNANGVPDECDVASFASATVTITAFTELNGDGNPGSDNVNLIATDGTNYNFFCGAQDSVEGNWEATTSNNQTATNLKDVINTTSGPAGTRFIATVDGAVVTITQSITGAAGDTTVSLTDSGAVGMTKTNFSGGVNGDVDCNANGVPDECDLEDPDNDQNNNGVLDECECLADIALDDGQVNVHDLLSLIAVWDTDSSIADINSDGIVDVSDLLIVIGNWGPCE